MKAKGRKTQTAAENNAGESAVDVKMCVARESLKRKAVKANLPKKNQKRRE